MRDALAVRALDVYFQALARLDVYFQRALDKPDVFSVSDLGSFASRGGGGTRWVGYPFHLTTHPPQLGGPASEHTAVSCDR